MKVNHTGLADNSIKKWYFSLEQVQILFWYSISQKSYNVIYTCVRGLTIYEISLLCGPVKMWIQCLHFRSPILQLFWWQELYLFHVSNSSTWQRVLHTEGWESMFSVNEYVEWLSVLYYERAMQLPLMLNIKFSSQKYKREIHSFKESQLYVSFFPSTLYIGEFNQI